MIVSFDDTVPGDEIDRYLTDMEDLLNRTALVESFAARRHLRIPVDDHSPVFVASAVVQLGVADLDTLSASFTLPELEEFIQRWQARYPYRVVWVNHEPLA